MWLSLNRWQKQHALDKHADNVDNDVLENLCAVRTSSYRCGNSRPCQVFNLLDNSQYELYWIWISNPNKDYPRLYSILAIGIQLARMILRSAGIWALFLQPFPRDATSQTLRWRQRKRRKKTAFYWIVNIYIVRRLCKVNISIENIRLTAAQVKRPHKIPVPNVTTSF